MLLLNDLKDDNFNVEHECAAYCVIYKLSWNAYYVFLHFWWHIPYMRSMITYVPTLSDAIRITWRQWRSEDVRGLWTTDSPDLLSYSYFTTLFLYLPPPRTHIPPSHLYSPLHMTSETQHFLTVHLPSSRQPDNMYMLAQWWANITLSTTQYNLLMGARLAHFRLWANGEPIVGLYRPPYMKPTQD